MARLIACCDAPNTHGERLISRFASENRLNLSGHFDADIEVIDAPIFRSCRGSAIVIT